MVTASILWILPVGIVFYFLMKNGGGCCGKGHVHSGDGHGMPGSGAQEKHEHHDGMNIEGDRNMYEKDPVCGMRIHDRSISGSHMGQTFHFCSDQCRKIFALNPNKYVRT